MLFGVAAIAVLVAMALALVRAALGPTVYDRVLAVNAFGTKTVLMIAVLGFLAGRPEFLDIALLYALINFIGTIAVSKLCATRTWARPRPSGTGSLCADGAAARHRGLGSGARRLLLTIAGAIGSSACRTSTLGSTAQASSTRSGPGCCCSG